MVGIHPILRSLLSEGENLQAMWPFTEVSAKLNYSEYNGVGQPNCSGLLLLFAFIAVSAVGMPACSLASRLPRSSFVLCSAECSPVAPFTIHFCLLPLLHPMHL